MFVRHTTIRAVVRIVPPPIPFPVPPRPPILFARRAIAESGGPNFAGSLLRRRNYFHRCVFTGAGSTRLMLELRFAETGKLDNPAAPNAVPVPHDFVEREPSMYPRSQESSEESLKLAPSSRDYAFTHERREPNGGWTGFVITRARSSVSVTRRAIRGANYKLSVVPRTVTDRALRCSGR